MDAVSTTIPEKSPYLSGNVNLVENTSDEDVALVYRRLVRHESPAAAVVIEQIHTQFGSKDALRAALIIMLLKNELQHFESLTELEMYTSLQDDAPEALPLLQAAISCCQKSWGFPQNETSSRGNRQWPTGARNYGLEDPFEELLQRVHQQSPITAVKLEQIHRTYGATAGGYAATALIWLEAYDKRVGADFLTAYTDKEIQDFSFFQYMHANADAIVQFTQMLECYRIEHRPTAISAFSATYQALAAEQRAGNQTENNAR